MTVGIIDLLDEAINNGSFHSKEKLKEIKMEFHQISDKMLIDHIKGLKQNGVTPRMINIILHIIKDTQHIVEQLIEVIDSYKQIQEDLKIKIIELEDNKNL
jgi:DNA-binding HxlR family transcriptional regulator